MSIKGIHVVRKSRPDGTFRYYYYSHRGGPRFWVSDKIRIDLPGKKLPPDFLEAFAQISQLEPRVPRNTFAGAITLYRQKCAAFQKMKAKGRSARIKYLEAWTAMPLHQGKPAGDAPLAVFDSRKIIKYITAYRDRTWGHSTSAADEAVIALSAFLSWCKRDGRLDWNRAMGIEKTYERPTQARIWSVEEQELFLASAPRHLAWGFRLLLHTGLRREDLIRLPLSAIRGQHLLIPTGKSRGRQTALIPITPPLRQLLLELETERSALATPITTVLFSSRGRPWSAEGFGTSFDRHRKSVGLGPEANGPTIHDMRKTCATNMVILQHQYPQSISDQVLIDLFGWTPKTLAKMKRIYVSDSAVIEALSGSLQTRTGTEPVNFPVNPVRTEGRNTV